MSRELEFETRRVVSSLSGPAARTIETTATHVLSYGLEQHWTLV